MPEKENYTSQGSDSKFLYKGKFLNDKFYRKNHWSLLRFKQVLKDFKLLKKNK
ncbi:MAG: hypothetical protein IGS23_15275 [Rivularia sp. T60_A2020_040]|nr:hypothetical protein [Rivularia sp. T60_A2020_040]